MHDRFRKKKKKKIVLACLGVNQNNTHTSARAQQVI